ncbi:hypothetical protein H0N98_02320 [Candidatus Micrarchaeota archaeon]|nr:hypothetical protein [Candidatus Micrarchaeota archaeon]
MEEIRFKILDTLTRDLSSGTSINELTGNIGKLYNSAHYTAYYKTIYDKIHELEKQNIISLAKIGNVSIPRINFDNYLTIDFLTEMELRKKQTFLEKNTETGMLFLEIETYFKEFYFIKSISIIDPEKNIKLNRAEFLFILNGLYEHKEKPGLQEAIQNEIAQIYSIMEMLQRIHNIKLDYLILNKKEFTELLKREETNPLKEMLSNKVAFFAPQAFWVDIKTILSEGIQIKAIEETNPAKIAEQDLIYNLIRFGYKEFGPRIKEGKKICIETIITSLLLRNNARRIQIIPTLLAKNRYNYNSLIFLCKKYNKLEKLFGLIRGLNKIKPSTETETAIKMIEAMGIKEEKIDEKSIKQKMELYNAI